MKEAFYASVKDVLSYFDVTIEKGLTSQQIIDNRRKYGNNSIPPPNKTSWLGLIIKQFEDLLVLILLGSAIVSLFLGFIEHNEGDSYLEIFIEPSVIMLILIANAIVGVWQESSAEDAIEKLKEYEAKEAIVIRNGKEMKVNREELVPGDIIKIKVGDKIPADARIIKLVSRTFRTDESMLTGETHAQYKTLDILKLRKNVIVDQDKCNILFSGTLAVHGTCYACVVLTGKLTSMGKISAGLMSETEKTPLGEKLDEFAELLSKVILGICILVWVINIGHFKEHGGYFSGAIYYLKIAIALAVAAIPEGLPAVVTTCLALGTMKMAKNNAIIRSLPSCETLGCTTIICSDKTGTLTTNQMSVRKMFVIKDINMDKDEYIIDGTTFKPIGNIKLNGNIINKTKLINDSISIKFISKISILCNDANLTYEKDGNNVVHWHITGEPTEGALKVLSEKIGTPGTHDDITEANILSNYKNTNNYWYDLYEKIMTFEFTRDRKCMSIIVKNRELDKLYLLVKGAPECILNKSVNMILQNHNIININDDYKNKINHYVSQYANQGLRCLGFGFKELNHIEYNKIINDYAINDDYDNIEGNLTFVGVTGMLDPPRKEVANAIRVCQHAGIKIIVITGDNKSTAEAICKKIGIFSENESLKGKSYTGSEFFGKFNDDEQLNKINDISLFSRVMPSHKKIIVSLLQKKNHVVAMTGDGVNDAPALRKADIGIGMGTGTEVAKQSSDMILADDNFSTIVSAVKEGRAIYSNTKQFIRYLISSNIGEVACIFLTALLGLPESLIPVQLLWVNLVTDGLPATALGFNKPDKNIMNLPPRGKNEKIINGWMFFRYFLIGIYVGVATIIGFIWWFTMYENGPQISYLQLSHFHACSNTASKNHDIYFNSDNWNNNCDIFYNPAPSTVSLSILVTIEMFNTFNALSENQSLLSTPPWDNIWVVLAVILSMFLHSLILYIPFLRGIFRTSALNTEEWFAVIAISFPVIIIDEILKAITRRIQAREKDETKKNV